MRDLKYEDLPASSAGIHLLCEDACENAGPWSATRGDYWMRDDDEAVLCECGALMLLVREHHSYEPIDPDTGQISTGRPSTWAEREER